MLSSKKRAFYFLLESVNPRILEPFFSFNYLELQVEQLVEEQVPQDELAVLLNFPPTEKAKADIIRWTFLPLH
jgi:hypothetical protein